MLHKRLFYEISAALVRECLELVASAGSVYISTLFLVFSAAADIFLCIRFQGIPQLFRVVV
jgi:hypothetical protein